jgi:acylglycerol lipase
MEVQEFSWNTEDGIQLFARDFRPANTAQAVICLVHGLGEHSGRYFHVGEALTRSGFAVLTMDLRGCGKSGGLRGHSPSYDHLLDDLSILVDHASSRYPRLPLFLYGHSFGASLVVNYVIRRRPSIAGVILTGLGLSTHPRPPRWKIGLVKVLNRVWPTFPIKTELKREGLSRNLDVVREYNQDPLVHDTVTARFGIQAIQNNTWALEHAQEFYPPLLFMYGTCDQVISMDDLHEFISKVKGDVTIHAWEGCYHEIHNEPCKEEVFAQMIAWLQARTHTSSSPIHLIERN